MAPNSFRPYVGIGGSLPKPIDDHKPFYQPTCIGLMPFLENDDLLRLNLWNNHPNELTNFCMGTPMWTEVGEYARGSEARLTDPRYLGLAPGTPIWSPLCRCRSQAKYGLESDEMRCFMKPQRPRLERYCRDHCYCKRPLFMDRVNKLGKASEGGLQNLPPNSPNKLKGIKTNDGTLNCAQKFACFFGCSTPYTKETCRDMACVVNQVGPGLFSSQGRCVATNRLGLELGSLSGLGGRDVADKACPCNATYVSKQCCYSKEGIVWEEELSKLGILLEDKAENKTELL